MDLKVKEAQEWLNANYGDHPDFKKLEPNGETGSLMFQALTKAWQIELNKEGHTDLPVTGTFGDKTKAISPTLSPDSSGVYVTILQYALFCKGYTPYDNLGQFKVWTTNAVKKLQADAGLPEGEIREQATPFIEAAIFSPEYYVKVRRGDSRIRDMQQVLNRKYSAYTGLGPCDGIFSRATAIALIYALQAEEKLPIGVANGNFGPTTQRCLPTIPYNGVEKSYANKAYNSNEIDHFTYIVQYALYCYGHGEYTATGPQTSKYDPGEFQGIFDNSTKKALHAFQKDVALPIRDIVGKDEWMALLVSTGNPNRDGAACDCATKLNTPTRAQAVVRDEYSIAGRYLTGVIYNQYNQPISKALDKNEMKTIFDAGLRLFVIFQDARDWYQANPNEEDLHNYFSNEQGKIDAEKATKAAMSLEVPIGEYIYFAVDYDFYEFEVQDMIMKYFEGIRDYSISNFMPYSIGIYGARNTCKIIKDAGLSTSSFVGDLSTGFSGNLGYPLPDDWAFDQVKEYTLACSSGNFAIDKDVTSGRYSGFKKAGTDEWAYRYGAVKNPVTGEIYPIYLDENFKQVISPAYEREVNSAESKPTIIKQLSFNLPSFLAGLAIDDSWDNNPWMDLAKPELATSAGIFIGGVVSVNDNIDSVYMSIEYFKNKETGQKRAIISCGDNEHYRIFQNINYELPLSLRDNNPDSALWVASADAFAKKQYELITGKQLPFGYFCEIKFKFNPDRKNNSYLTQLFFGKDGKIYEYVCLYPDEKIELLVMDRDPDLFPNVIERLDLTQILNPVSELPADKQALFNVQLYR